jgi:hypothetical protein
VLQAVGKAAAGHITADAYLITVVTSENREFLKAWRARYPDAPIGYRYPDLTIGRCFCAVTWLGDVIKRAGSLDTAKVVKAWEGSVRRRDHGAEKIPQDIRYFGNEFPYIGPATLIPRDEMTVPPRETGNKRCA